MLDKIIIAYTLLYAIFFVVFLLYQFEILDIDEDFMIRLCRLLNLVEIILLVITRFMDYDDSARMALAMFYVLNVILLALQFIFADWGVGQKILDVFWISFYVVLFLGDICGVKGIEECLSLGSILNSEEMSECLDPELIFNMRVFYTSSYGIGMRDIIGHGLRSDVALQKDDSLATWWFTLRLVCQFSFELHKRIHDQKSHCTP